MKTETHRFSQHTTLYHLGATLANLGTFTDPQRSVLLVDENVNRHYAAALEGWKKIIVPAGEDHKNMAVVGQLIDQLAALEADRKTTLVGVGGGMTTDVTGFVAAIYMRGVPFGFVPTTLLAQVDASLGGKNGVSQGMHKNLLGTIRQPAFILFDYTLPSTMPPAEWHNGFAEIIKYACIQDAALFEYLETHVDQALHGDVAVLQYLVECSVNTKTRIVLEDEFETGIRRWLNFGHTLGHAVEKLEHIGHGEAVSIGMVAASRLSEIKKGLPPAQTQRLIRLLQAYQLPVALTSDKKAVYDIFRLDKKREKDFIHFVLLESIGQATTEPILLTELQQLLEML
ncbi:3-dehydroquinate synthase [Chitinophaga costaii]|uniref:3-dehydroquinate synthase n=2 Tax=Chitinophaga costaii TaxID=1335309 RepID=A0A1C3ZD13_9BACT|nr:3-dehydroquinate synthase [Chitinophaga costaii]SCB80163.1 3-dehydroquinate synthase [Chitinophaga costaii]